MLARRLDIILAAIISIGSAGIFIDSYRAMNAAENTRSAITFLDGTSRFFLTDGHGCFGTVELVVQHDPNITVTSTAKIASVQHRKRTESVFTLGLAFNPLGQLIEGMLEIHSAGNNMVIRSQSVNPIVINVLGHAGERRFDFDFSVPGPLEVQRESATSLGLRHPMLLSLRQNPLSGFLSANAAAPGLNVVPADSMPACSTDELTPIELDAVAASLEKLLPLAAESMPDAMALPHRNQNFNDEAQ